jgi:hypothetical protein
MKNGGEPPVEIRSHPKKLGNDPLAQDIVYSGAQNHKN